MNSGSDAQHFDADAVDEENLTHGQIGRRSASRLQGLFEVRDFGDLVAGNVLGYPVAVRHGGVDAADGQAPGMRQDFAQGAHVIGMRVGDEPRLDVVAQRGQKPAQIGRVACRAAVNDDKLAARAADHVGHHLAGRLLGQLPKRAGGLPRSMLVGVSGVGRGRRA